MAGEPERLWTGSRWGEGPVWLPGLDALRWSDIPNNRIMQWHRETGETIVYDDAPEFTNGRTLDLAGQVVQCSHGRRRVERDVDGVVTSIVDAFDGRRLNSPNDVVVASDGAIWFTDPPYGIQPDEIEGHAGVQEYGGCFVFRFVEATGELTPVITDMVRPNGLAFSPDESVLYVANTGDGQGDRDYVRAFDVVGAGVANPRELGDPSAADGFRVDVEGRIWTSWSRGPSGGVAVWAPDGTELARVDVGERTANVAFGGPDGDELYITASTSLYRLRTTTTAAPRPEPLG
ncbi:SMP-30/gluconolactonase/LRE family protein [Pseudolysinimonas kribbensis]|uniref:SMP-30/gluconolactonase/LRE family protein n=1 Tax=Pseudolysinimonas kribbensis TaxID=433641 RepID=UPI0024E149B8|nr:SMP-30/gluconolactonase/LRE family protein [Pseudolysinimonas kribbensis]